MSILLRMDSPDSHRCLYTLYRHLRSRCDMYSRVFQDPYESIQPPQSNHLRLQSMDQSYRYNYNPSILPRMYKNMMQHGPHTHHHFHTENCHTHQYYHCTDLLHILPRSYMRMIARHRYMQLHSHTGSTHIHSSSMYSLMYWLT